MSSRHSTGQQGDKRHSRKYLTYSMFWLSCRTHILIIPYSSQKSRKKWTIRWTEYNSAMKGIDISKGTKERIHRTLIDSLHTEQTWGKFGWSAHIFCILWKSQDPFLAQTLFDCNYHDLKMLKNSTSLLAQCLVLLYFRTSMSYLSEILLVHSWELRQRPQLPPKSTCFMQINYSWHLPGLSSGFITLYAFY